jgi:hypothetical protein
MRVGQDQPLANFHYRFAMRGWYQPFISNTSRLFERRNSTSRSGGRPRVRWADGLRLLTHWSYAMGELWVAIEYDLFGGAMPGT